MGTASGAQQRAIPGKERAAGLGWATRALASVVCVMTLTAVAGCGATDSAVIVGGNAGGSTSQSITKDAHDSGDTADSADSSDSSDSDDAADTSGNSMDDMTMDSDADSGNGNDQGTSAGASADTSASPSPSSSSSSSMDMDGDCCHH
ncbi:MAG: hypothetical protein ACI38B_07395 [Bifidobacterium sp.]|uniref:hypothetical protein n=1 Tax=Bifidobacterium sp. TaxID=41200 RepID=UPI003F047B34